MRLILVNKNSHAILKIPSRRILQFWINLKATLPAWYLVDGKYDIFVGKECPNITFFLSLSLVLDSANWRCSYTGIFSLPKKKPFYSLHFTCDGNFSDHPFQSLCLPLNSIILILFLLYSSRDFTVVGNILYCLVSYKLNCSSVSSCSHNFLFSSSLLMSVMIAKISDLAL